ncbi:RNA-binding protein 18 [Takifugu flavidus]|uniref:Probable RNA-binding protein 18 n=1 Tax=Takifugu flavidus TaxID=433684 RepID=A0A5C6NFN1_9TELE|nr:RNA-binding protein 18 [Takifugu flavidus]
MSSAAGAVENASVISESVAHEGNRLWIGNIDPRITDFPFNALQRFSRLLGIPMLFVGKTKESSPGGREGWKPPSHRMEAQSRGGCCTSLHLLRPDVDTESPAPGKAGAVTPRQKGRRGHLTLPSAVFFTRFHLVKLLEKFGHVKQFDFLFHKSGPLEGQPRGYCFVNFNTREEAERAIQRLNGKLALSKKLVVRWAHAQVSIGVDSSTLLNPRHHGSDPIPGTSGHLAELQISVHSMSFGIGSGGRCCFAGDVWMDGDPLPSTFRWPFSGLCLSVSILLPLPVCVFIALSLRHQRFEGFRNEKTMPQSLEPSCSTAADEGPVTVNHLSTSAKIRAIEAKLQMMEENPDDFTGPSAYVYNKPPERKRWEPYSRSNHKNQSRPFRRHSVPFATSKAAAAPSVADTSAKIRAIEAKLQMMEENPDDFTGPSAYVYNKPPERKRWEPYSRSNHKNQSRPFRRFRR